MAVEPGRPLLLVVACALLNAGGQVLLAERPPGRRLAGLWEFPGGKIEAGERPEGALVRELHEELGIIVEERALQPLTFASYAYDDFHLLMPLFLCRAWRGDLTPREGQTLSWVSPAELSPYAMPPADEPLKPILAKLLRAIG